MGTTHKPKAGSLQYWPRKRAERILPNVNWNAIKSTNAGLMGFIGYKVGMTSAFVKDETADSMTKGKKIIVPATIVECPELKIFSVRFYKDKKVAGDVIVSNDKELKRVVKVPKQVGKIEDFKNDFDDVRVIVYSDVKKTDVKKAPDMIELAIVGTKEQKLAFVKDKAGKSISVSEIFSKGLVDVRGVTTGHGLQGPVKRIGITLKSHKSEKGVRRPGNLAPWHPARVTFVTAMAGQFGFFTRVLLNNTIIKQAKISELNINKNGGFPHYGNIKTEFLVISGSLPGPQKRPLLLTAPLRPTKSVSKRKWEFIELR
jgi:large subunit ribosomal protein L3